MGQENAKTPVKIYPAVILSHSQGKGTASPKRREQKAQEVLFGLLEHYLHHGKPVGSQTLKEAGFNTLSSATIRNYFAYLEKEGLVAQMHSSGGRIPTDQAWRLYVDAHPQPPLSPQDAAELKQNLEIDPTCQDSLAQTLEHACQNLSTLLQHTTFLIPPSFEHDQPQQVKIWPISATRSLCITVTQLGFIRHDSFELPRLERSKLDKIERYIEDKMCDPFAPESITLNGQDKEIAHTLYNELIVRHLMALQKDRKEIIFKAGLSRLLEHTEMNRADQLLPALNFFESVRVKEKLLSSCYHQGRPHVWIGTEAHEIFLNTTECSLFAAPLRLGQRCIGAIGVLTPKRAAYLQILQSIDYLSCSISAYLTRSYYTHQISHNLMDGENPTQQPSQKCPLYLESEHQK